MVFKRMLSALGVGGPSVDTVLDHPHVLPGQRLSGQVHLLGGDRDVDIEHLTLTLVTRVEVESGDSEYSAETGFHQVPVSGPFRLTAGAKHAIPFAFDVPWETPVTDVYGQRLPGMTMGLRTDLAVARMIDKGDLDAFSVHPLPIQQRILDAFAQLGFRFLRADLERGRLRGVQQALPFYQEIEFHPPAQYAHAVREVELTFVAAPHGLDVVLEFDKRGGLLHSGQDAYSHFQVPHTDAERPDWPTVVESWVREAVERHRSGFGSHGGHAGYGPGQHGKGQGHHRGSGLGGVAAGAAAGLVGGYLLGEAIEGAGDAVDEVAGDFGDFGGDW